MMEDVSKVEVRFNLQMDELQWFWQHANVTRDQNETGSERSYRLPNLPVTVVYRVAGRTYSWLGHLSRYDGASVNAATRTVPCIVAVDDPRKTQTDGASPGAQLAAPPALMNEPSIERRTVAFPWRGAGAAALARDRLRAGKRVRWTDRFLSPPARFLRTYFLRLGILDGWRNT